jgi:hypothetical protein
LNENGRLPESQQAEGPDIFVAHIMITVIHLALLFLAAAAFLGGWRRSPTWLNVVVVGALLASGYLFVQQQ